MQSKTHKQVAQTKKVASKSFRDVIVKTITATTSVVSGGGPCPRVRGSLRLNERLTDTNHTRRRGRDVHRILVYI